MKKLLTAAASLAVFAPVAAGANLVAPPGAPAWMQWGADALLYSHIGGGAIGILTGAVAILSPKGASVHRAAGTLFFAAMLACYIIAAGVSPFLDEEQRVNTVAGVMALYLLISGWTTVRTPETRASAWHALSLVIALTIAAAGGYFMHLGSLDPSGTVDGSPPQAFVLFIVAGGFAALGEANVLLRGEIKGVARIARHLWRMCCSLFIAAGSFFLGQMQFLPLWMQESPAPYVLALAPLAAMAFFIVRVRIGRRFKDAAAA
jgi:uncharacterized membrane protein